MTNRRRDGWFDDGCPSPNLDRLGSRTWDVAFSCPLVATESSKRQQGATQSKGRKSPNVVRMVHDAATSSTRLSLPEIPSGRKEPPMACCQRRQHATSRTPNRHAISVTTEPLCGCTWAGLRTSAAG
jgi:hypothetical protein